MFEKATRLHLRYDTIRGLITVEDLWDVPLISRNGFDLDSIARNAHRALKEQEETVSFVVKSNKASDTAQLAFDVVKYVIDVKLAEQAEATEASIRLLERRADKMMFDNYRAQYLADFTSKGHTPYLDEDGKVDLFITDQGMHNGPGCSVCGWTTCMLCLVGEIPVCRPAR